MPLLLCPNDNGPMQTVQRSGVEFDMCPTCRGVWLDRGELEKLLAAGREGESRERPGEDERPARTAFASRPQPEQHKRRDWDDDDRSPQRKRRSSIFDIFD